MTPPRPKSSLFRKGAAALLGGVCLLWAATVSGCGDRQRPAVPSDCDEALELLDLTMARSSELDASKRHKIDSITGKLNTARTPAERYTQLEQLYQEYRSYAIDSLLYISRQCEREAALMHNDSLLNNAYILQAESYKGTGNYAAALASLEKIQQPWHDTFRRRILNRYCSIYYSLAEHSSTDEDRAINTGKLKAYRDSIIAMTDPGSPDYWLNNASRQLAAGDYTGCLASLDSLTTVAPNDVNPGVMDYTWGRSYEAIGDMKKAKYHYARAAIYDLEHSVRKYEALQELARILSSEGDNERAFKYIMKAINDIHASHATSRIQRISSYLPIISATYTDAQHESTRNKNILLVTAAILLVGLCVATFYAIRKNRRLNIERSHLTRKNEELQQLRASLTEANSLLKESSKIKEDYLGILFNLCADYIDTLDKFRIQLSQRLKAGKVKDISTALAAPVGADLLQSFFQKFDSIFLDIFPDFIDRFNELMKPDHKLQPRPGELLSPELRIYALVRLGITDSTKIAAFLHYSPQTVYNYRFRVRSNARIPKEEFPRAVRML